MFQITKLTVFINREIVLHHLQFQTLNQEVVTLVILVIFCSHEKLRLLPCSFVSFTDFHLSLIHMSLAASVIFHFNKGI